MNTASWFKTTKGALVNAAFIEQIRLDEGARRSNGDGPITHYQIIADHGLRNDRFYLTGPLPEEDAQSVLDAIHADLCHNVVDVQKIIDDTLENFDTSQTDAVAQSVVSEGDDNGDS